MKNKNLLIFGNTQMAEIANYYFKNYSDYDVSGFVVDIEYKESESFENKRLYSTDEILENNLQADHDIFIAIGYSNSNKTRSIKFNFFKEKNFTFASYVSDKATVLTKDIGSNCLILEDNTIQPFTKIGNNCFLWSGNHIGHHSIIENNCFISSHVVVSGNCLIGQGSFLGVNSSIANGVTIGSDVFIGMGVNITKNINSATKVTIKNSQNFL